MANIINEDPKVVAAQASWFYTKWAINYLLAIGCNSDEINIYLEEFHKDYNHERAMKVIGKDPNTKVDWSKLFDIKPASNLN